MGVRYAIGPSIGIARLGNSIDSFYLGPDAIGTLPIECDSQGNPLLEGGLLRRVNRFKDPTGRVRRQAAWYRVFRLEEDKPTVEVTITDPSVRSITWTVHLANKKASWYNFAELEGNLLYGEGNSYENKRVPPRNADKTGIDQRRKLIIDPGPRTVSGGSQQAQFSKATVPPNYKFASFPSAVLFGDQIDTLGEMRTDAVGRLIVLGGFGKSGGDQSISSFAGADTWHDDISDGPVWCTLELVSGEKIELDAWCLVGSPKFVPEIVNIVTLDDAMLDVAIRHMDYAPNMYSNSAFREDYLANFDRDIKPIIERPGAYRWVANAPAMNSVSPPPFDPRDRSSSTAPLRKAYLELFRKPSPERAVGLESNRLFCLGGFPLMPLNSGSNSVSNAKDLIDKFLTLTETQYFLLEQWAHGKFTTGTSEPVDIVTALTKANVGNCVGGPFCPGIEVTWSMRNPNIYQAPFKIGSRHCNRHYLEYGLDPNEDETADKQGCEPGDMTKRMAIPWQADFFQCSIQFINFTDPKANKNSGIPEPPTYYSYWWPPQSPWLVMTGDLTTNSQLLAGTPAGYQVLFTRGINTFAEMISSWHYMGFIVNQVTTAHRDLFPYFTEQERSHEKFIAAAVSIGDAGNVVTGADANFSNAWFLPQVPQEPVALPLAGAETMEGIQAPATARQVVSFSTGRQRGRRSLRED